MGVETTGGIDSVTVESNGLRWRVGQLEGRMTRVEDHTRHYGIVEARVESLSDDMRSLRKAFYTFAFAVVGSSIIFALTVFTILLFGGSGGGS